MMKNRINYKDIQYTIYLNRKGSKQDLIELKLLKEKFNKESLFLF